MKTWIKNPLPVLIAGLGLIAAGRVTAQTFTTLHSFTAFRTNSSGVHTNSDGINPYAGLILSSNTLYGTAIGGGSYGNGTVFRVNTDGTGFMNLHSFSSADSHTGTNSDGASPYAGLVLSGITTLYGTARYGGSSGKGTVFAVNTDGTGFTNLHSFTAPDAFTGTNSDGANPWAGLILSGNTLYGAAHGGGSLNQGTVFKLNTDGTGFTNLHNFTGGGDGAYPYAELVQTNDSLYGTAEEGGSQNAGTAFKLNSAGFTILHTFTTTLPTGDNSDGAYPYAGLVLSSGTLYGTAHAGGDLGFGTVFAVKSNGDAFRTLHSFSGGSDGSNPVAGLILSGNTLYGTAGLATVFAVNTDGTGFTTLHSFTGRDGAYPSAKLILSNNTLYGTTSGGGSYGNGTVFSISFRPRLNVTSSGANVILTWPTNVAGFDYSGYAVQSTMNFGASAVWTTNSPAPVVVNGQNTVTNPISGTQRFYRLSQ